MNTKINPLFVFFLSFLFLIMSTNCNAQEQNKGKIAILYFENNAVQSCFSPLSKGLCDMMISDFTSEKQFAVVERARLQEIINELKMEQNKIFDSSTTAKLGKLLGADCLILGAFFEFMGTFRIDARIVKVETGEILASVGASGKVEAFELLEKKIVSDLHVKMKKYATKVKRVEKCTVSLRGAAQYGTAIDKIDSGDVQGARALLKDIVEDSPDFALAKDMLRKISQ